MSKSTNKCLTFHVNTTTSTFSEVYLSEILKKSIRVLKVL